MQRAHVQPSPGAGPSQAPPVDPVEYTQDDDAALEDADDAMDLMGSFRTKVVGVRYYTGMANPDEMVLLIREPNNPYDRWAIRVDNVRGEKIGHVSREQAAVMSPLIDAGQLRIEGLVQGAKGAYSMPIDLLCFCPPEYMSTVTQRLRNGGVLVNRGGGSGQGGAGQAAPAGVRMLTQSERDTSLDRMFDEVHATGNLQPAMEPDAEVLSRLFPHQRVALAWMVGRENGSGLPPFWEVQQQRGGGVRYINTLTNFAVLQRPESLRGGILADDMGLGKTLTVISLIATNRPGVQLPPTQMISLVAEDSGTSTGAAAGGGGAAAAAASAAGAGAAKKGKAGGKKGRAARETGDQLDDGPIAKRRKTSAAGGSTAAAGPSAAGAGGSAADAPPQPPRADGPLCTLIVCPLSVMSNWATQIQEHTAGNLKVYQYHGPDRCREASFLASHDVVFTSYSVLGADLADRRGLLAVDWLRVVLDEAHTIKNPRAKWSQAAAKLKAERRWAVTGTPIQNRLGDLYGQLCYLGLEPLNERSIFNRVLERPLKACDPRAVKKLQVLMHTIAMRRTKDLQINGKPLVVLPRKTINMVNVNLTREDRVKYDALELQARQIIARALQSETLMENYMSVLEIILRLRQVADAGCLCTRDPLPLSTGAARRTVPQAASPITEEERKSLVGLLAAGLQDDCAICLETLNQTACITRCRHIFCKSCIENVIVRAANPSCPLCRAKISTGGELVDLPPDTVMDQTQAGTDVEDPVAASAKVAALIQTLRATASQQPLDGNGPVKSVVFSQFTGMLNLVGRALDAVGLPYVRLDGSTPAKQRAGIVREFARREAGSPVVFLVSLKAGGVGMNLTAANHVHLLDPWWNPSVEEQAMDRVHRLGQTRDVEVYRYVAADTIEERMLLLQERKRELANAAFDRRSADENRQMRIDDVKLLMDL